MFLYPSDFLPWWVIPLGVVFAGCLISYFLISDLRQKERAFDQRQRQLEQMWDGAIIAKICRDGTRIYKLRDGRYFAGGWGSTQPTGTEVCQ